MTITPDGKKVYVATERTDTISVVDTTTMKELTRIPTGGYNMPKRSDLAMLP